MLRISYTILCTLNCIYLLKMKAFNIICDIFSTYYGGALHIKAFSFICPLGLFLATEGLERAFVIFTYPQHHSSAILRSALDSMNVSMLTFTLFFPLICDTYNLKNARNKTLNNATSQSFVCACF